MTTLNDHYDDEIARLTLRRTQVRARIDKQLFEDMAIGQFEGTTITRLSMDNLERQERVLTDQINRFIAKKHGQSWRFGRMVELIPANPHTSGAGTQRITLE